MKKLFIAVSIAAVVASCTKNEFDSSNTGKEIRFVNLNDKVTTRAANDGGDDYQVYAKWTGGTSWFINDVINGSGADVNKPQNGPYYWPTSGTMDFYSWAPASITATGAYPALSIAYTVPTTADEDFTIAVPQTGLSANTVAFEFSHMLAQIVITVDLDQDMKDAGYALSFANGKASLEVQSTGGTIDPTITTPVWSSPNATTASYSENTEYIIMPQASTGCKVQITEGVTITKNSTPVFTGGLKQYTIVADDITGNVFAQGKSYVLKMIVSSSATGSDDSPIFGDEITFSASISPAWDVIANTTLPQP